uniref:Zn(2)-C6 fungal-type domain-containing protein n=1 Tax=Guillardia theta TaxID=55529 RepID=A0A7S4JTH2_GUITH|mmetsp:Transcript_18361/g.60293  ORF Transcript_18361/g.60293 Transcript_18361/m.60293 type:complete len:485 (+) Transcript_18361:110-1564(+)
MAMSVETRLREPGQTWELNLMTWLEIPSEEEDVKERERSSNSRAKKACDSCRMLKLKCDDEEPCSRCLQAGRGSSCVRSVSSQPVRCRLKGLLACSACRQAKARCDEFRPCARCVKLNRGDRCSEDGTIVPRSGKKLGWMEEEKREGWEEQLMQYVKDARMEEMLLCDGLQVVERPLPFVDRTLSFDKPSGIRGRMNAMGWPEFVLARHWEFGFSEEHLMRVFTSLPPYLEQVAKRAMEALECLYHARQVQQQAMLCGMEEEEAADLGPMHVECEMMNQTERMGWLLQGFTPSCMRRKVVLTNSGMGRVTGMHVEEFLARVANRELPVFATELNFFCYVMYSSLMHATSSTRQLTVFSRIPDLSEGGGRATMVKMVQERCLDWRGRLTGMRSYFCPVTKEEFDCLYQNEPRRFRPLAWVLGDDRSYDQLMSDFPSDYAKDEVIANMAATEQGQRKLYRLAEELERLYAPLVAQAQKIKSNLVMK